MLSTSLFRDLENCFFQDGCDPIAAITACVTDQSLKSRLLNLDVEPTPMSVAEFKKFVAEEIAKYAKVVQFAGIKVERKGIEETVQAQLIDDNFGPTVRNF